MKHNLFYVLAAILFFGCTKNETDSQPDRIMGQSAAMGSGKVTTWMSLDAQGNPASIGFTMTKEALESMPSIKTVSAYMLALPDEAIAKTPYKHVMIDWNPQGHEPAGIYDVPHFDFHFYMQPMNEVMAIPAYEKAPAKFDNVPAASYLPVDFVKGPGGVPAMGAHWSDVTSPEFKGQPFTETFVFGSYDGKVTFWEQMVTLDFLKSKPALDKAIRQPAQFQVPGYYPTRYSIRTNADGSQDIAMDGLTKR
ncbi:DUF5602 domain-containing protein [Spirosoma rigui]|uniref:DUF5602 domain-containing protein n=1 Tax=Spirosoma rigui TaxID=564064 RepID=UPI0009B1825F|nr:DUF5602 domain-containing protein [Spirosoma rigui]